MCVHVHACVHVCIFVCVHAHARTISAHACLCGVPCACGVYACVCVSCACACVHHVCACVMHACARCVHVHAVCMHGRAVCMCAWCACVHVRVVCALACAVAARKARRCSPRHPRVWSEGGGRDAHSLRRCRPGCRPQRSCYLAILSVQDMVTSCSPSRTPSHVCTALGPRTGTVPSPDSILVRRCPRDLLTPGLLPVTRRQEAA